MKYVLGTAQFGLDYGISNNEGKISSSVIQEILEGALEYGVDYLDTANVYGDAEKRIGEFFELTKQFKLITKTAHTKINSNSKENISLINDELEISLSKMKRDSVDVLLVHNAKEILSIDGSEIFQSLIGIKKSGLAKKIGVSVYSLEELRQVNAKYSVDVIQFPLNVFNQSFCEPGILNELNIQGIELHARSVFLQGILLMDTSNLDNYFDSIKSIHSSYQEVLFQKKLSLVEGALNYVKQVNELDAVIFGVQNSKQLIEIINALESKLTDINYKNFIINDENITNPSRWIDQK